MYNEKGILWKSILEIQGIPLIVIPYRYGVLTLFQAKEMTLPQQNTASARPTSFYYLMCQLDRVQYRKIISAILLGNNLN